MEKSIYTNRILGEIVAEDFRTAEIFENAGIDFCCGGKKTLEQACNEKALHVDAILKQLEELQVTTFFPGQNYSDWPLDFLADYIVNIHHRYVFKTIPELVFYTQKISHVHGNNHPELLKINGLFSQIREELVQHLKKEEEVLFPAIKEALKSNSAKVKETIHSEITRMYNEHEYVGGTMDKMKEISKDFHVPADGCDSYAVTYKLLKQFTNDLHIHVHLENNILFPKALKL
jgi:regulator of cell morphogenesis and NO signaling